MAVRVLRMIGLAALILASTAHASAAAQAGGGLGERLAEIQEMVLYARYPEAIEAAQSLLGEEGLSARERNATLEVLATAQIANRDEDSAFETLRRLFARDPGHRLSDPDASPLVQSAFARARTGVGETVDVELRHESPGPLESRESPVIEVELGENADAVGETRVGYRYEGDPRYALTTMTLDDGIARARVPLRGGDDGAYSIEYYVAALSPSGATLSTLGSASEPLSLTVPARAATTSTALRPMADDPGTAADEGDDAGLLGQWWFWTAVGVVVVGGVAAAILLGPAQDGPPDGSLGNVDLGLRF